LCPARSVSLLSCFIFVSCVYKLYQAQLRFQTVTTMPPNTCQPPRPETFDLVRSPLAGFNLIDASAGTGKTYTICGLVLRLILEKKLTVEQILVVTYTEAATEDLRDRIRQKLRQALDAISNGPGDDEFLQEYLVGLEDCREAATLLSEGLRSFDEAAIFTIHGFCQRMLNENSFESNTLFDTDLIADDSYLYKEIVEDFWRRNFSQGSRLFCQYAATRFSPEALHDFLRPLIPHPFLQFIPDIDPAAGCTGLGDLEAAYEEAYRAVCREWQGARDEVQDDLLRSKILNRNRYRMKSMPVIISQMDDMAAAPLVSPDLFERFTYLTSGKIAAGTKTGEIPVILPFYDLCEALVRAGNQLCAQYERYLLALKKRLLDSFRQELTLRKARDNVFSFDDLLQRLHAALTKPGGAALAGIIAQKYPAALIDEFQDTDPLQFEIFNAIYHERALLYLIGDPKQAIYSFRGADIFTYMDAAAASPLAHHTLGVNYRSIPGLVQAVNTIFCRAEKSFIFETLSFQPVSTPPAPEEEYFTIDGKQEAPFILWHLGRVPEAAGDVSSPARNQRISKGEARCRIISLVADEVCRLLGLAADNRAMLNGRKLLPGDVAILVRKNDEARDMQQALSKMQVPSVLHSGEDLFVSEEAKEMSLLLQAIAQPNDIRRVKTGLLTRFFGLQANTIYTLQTDSPEGEAIIEYWLTQCRAYHELWVRYGFIQMFWTIMRENRVRQRLLSSENGERSLTNILHLAEILHRETTSQGLNMAALQGYLHDRMAPDQVSNTEHQLRLASDEDRVKIVTIHKAKGLEYPVVFCPFTWEGLRSDARKGCLFHRRQDDRKTGLFFDAGSPELENHLQEARQEEMAENLRLLYVALTRAAHRCYLVWGAINGAETSAPAYLLHQGSPRETAGFAESCESAAVIMQKAAERFISLSDHEIAADLQDLAAAAEGTIVITPVAESPAAHLLRKEEPPAALRSREFSGIIPHDWKISSFSSLIAGSATIMDHSPTLPKDILDPDEIPAGPAGPAGSAAQENSSFDIFSFPRGAQPGTFLHELLEGADFSSKPPVAKQVIYEKLQYSGYETTWHPVLETMLENLGSVRLHDDIPGLTLSGIPQANILHELEFYYPLARLSPAVVKRIFSSFGLPGSAETAGILAEQQLDRLTFSPSRGFMRGFIDLVFAFEGKFYLVDWKSNYLGSTIEDYRQDKLRDSVLSGFYFLQYHIYSLALHLYLEKRLPDYCYAHHFGGVFYLFVRGISQNLGPGFGIYYDCPSPALIEKMQANLLGSRESEA
jgi:exodeoxyribonuclease V beta subunit